MRQDPCIDADGEPVAPYGLAACYPERFEEGDGDDGVDDKAMGGKGGGAHASSSRCKRGRAGDAFVRPL